MNSYSAKKKTARTLGWAELSRACHDDAYTTTSKAAKVSIDETDLVSRVAERWLHW